MERRCVPIRFDPPGEFYREKEREKELCLTEGDFSEVSEWGKWKKNFLLTDTLQTRAVLTREEISSIGLCFSDLDENKNRDRQIGLKIKAQDSCNVVYIMWRFSPNNKIVILRKLNKGRHTHKDCLNEGYKTLANISLEGSLVEKELHSIKADLTDNYLVVYVDERRIWEGPLEKDLEDIKGPMGIRTDNGTFIFQMDEWSSIKKNCVLEKPD